MKNGFAGDVSKDNDKYDVSIGVKSFLLDTTLSGTLRVLDKLVTAKTKVDYSLLEGTTQVMTIATMNQLIIVLFNYLLPFRAWRCRPNTAARPKEP